MTTFRRHDETGIRNCRRDLFGQVWRCERIAVPNKDECRDGYDGKAGTTVDPWDNRLHLPRKSVDANRQAHADVDFAKGRILLMLRMQDRAQDLQGAFLQPAVHGDVHRIRDAVYAAGPD